MWNGTKMKPLGSEYLVKIMNPKTGYNCTVKFVIVKKDFHFLPGTNAIPNIALITANNKKFKMVAKASLLGSFNSLHPEIIITEFKNMFKERLDKLPGQVAAPLRL